LSKISTDTAQNEPSKMMVLTNLELIAFLWTVDLHFLGEHKLLSLTLERIVDFHLKP
jgi:hypothetical protein